jgi:3',5'-cyclic-nucleotide phosphodiesterase
MLNIIRLKKLVTLLFCIFFYTLNAQKNNIVSSTNNGFKIIPLGVKGGLDEANLSAYLVAKNGTDHFICLDAGTINAGLQKAVKNSLFNEPNAEEIQKKNIKAYFISHGHLDHLAGLVLNAPNDIAKPIYAFSSVIDVLKNNYFTWKSWANFANEGDKPILNKYTYQTLMEGKELLIPNTELFVTPYSLSHVNPYESSAFLVRQSKDYLLYLGDTGADTVEKSNKLELLWKAIAPLMKENKLKGIFIEVSFDNSIPDKSLFGHLTPKLLMQELTKLNELSDHTLSSTNIIVTHIKPCGNCEQNIKKQIKEANTLRLPIIYPKQGVAFILK